MSGVPYVPDSDTSREAAESVRSVVSSVRVRVYEYVRERGREGATSDEVEAALGLRHQTASARIRELVKKGVLTNSGARRRTRSGRTARVVTVPLAGSLRRSLLRSLALDLGDATPGSEEEAVAAISVRNAEESKRKARREKAKSRVEDPSILDRQQERVLAFLRYRGDRGATSDEAEVALALSHQCASARIRELVRKGLAEDSGDRRATRSGRGARVVVATEQRRTPKPSGAFRWLDHRGCLREEK